MSQLPSRADKASGGVDPTETVPDPENAISVGDIEETHAAYVRYLFYEDGEFRQGRLSLASQPIPTDAKAVSTGVYFLTPDQEDRLHEGQRSKILQDECNEDGRVAYTAVAESDALEDGVAAQTIIEWLSTFAEDWLNAEEYDLYYSGKRSIHLHTDVLVAQDALDDLQVLAEEFNEAYDADLDTNVYKENSQFRLIGAEHRETGFYKVPITSDATRADCIRSAQDPVEMDWPFEIPPPDHHDESLLARSESQSQYSPLPLPHYRPGIDGICPLPPEIGRQVRQGYIKGENGQSVESVEDESEYAHPFSPYKKTGGEDGRSVIVMEQVGGIRQDKWRRDIYVPADIEYAIGGGDGSFTRYNSKSLVRLSPRDYRKWEYGEGDAVVIIGGNSGSSRIFPVGEITKRLVATALKTKGREKALEILSNRGFDVGSSGYHPSQYHDQERSGGKIREAAKIKRGIEEGTRERSYKNISRAACRLLRMKGWDAAYRWCQNVFGQGFDAEETHEILKGFVEAYDDYSHVAVPEVPGEGRSASTDQQEDIYE